MPYQFIVVRLLHDEYPVLYALLRREQTLQFYVNEYANELRAAHHLRMDELRQAGPARRYLSSEALELAEEDLRNLLSGGPPAVESANRDLGGVVSPTTAVRARQYAIPHTGRRRPIQYAYVGQRRSQPAGSTEAGLRYRRGNYVPLHIRALVRPFRRRRP